MKRHNAIPVAVAMVALLIAAARMPIPRIYAQPAPKPAGLTLKIVNDELIKVNDGNCVGFLYAVKGSVIQMYV